MSCGRLILALVTLASLALCLLCAAAWVRSYRALDELYGKLGGADFFEVESYAGRCDVRIVYRYCTGPGTPPNLDPLRVARPFAHLQRLDSNGGGFVGRQRWPPGDASRWERDAALFPCPAFRRWLAWARDGPGRYDWVVWYRVPHWIPCVLSSLAPSVFAVKLARRRTTARGELCAKCGYDLRATPSRCPECGAVPTTVSGEAACAAAQA